MIVCVVCREYTDGPAIDWSGTAVDTISSTTLSAALTLTTNAHGQLNVATALSASIGSLHIALSGSGSSVFQAIVNLITPLLINVLQSAISGAVSGVLSSAIQALIASIPTAVQLLPGVVLQYGLIPTE
jgi:hypothetical protein